MGILTVSDFYKKLFGSKVYKISIDAGCTCPNRDGTLGTSGCIFCSASGSGDFTASRALSVKEQIQQAKKLVEAKCPSKKYIAYFQNFTNTYGNLDEIFLKWDQALQEEGICGIAIATRPDCVGRKVLTKLASLSQKTYVQLELGLQTTNEQTARYIRRGFESRAFERAVEEIHNACPKVHIVTHIIFGLPGETRDDMLTTVKNALEWKTDGLKITVLYVLKNTDLEKEYLNGKVKTLEMEEYMSILEEALALVPPGVVIHRVTGDPPKSLLIAPEWTKNKKLVLNRVKQLFLHVDSLSSNVVQ